MTDRRIQLIEFAGRRPIPTAATARERIRANVERAREAALNYAHSAARKAIEGAIGTAAHGVVVSLNDWPRGTPDGAKSDAYAHLTKHLMELGYDVSPGPWPGQLRVTWETTDEQ